MINTTLETHLFVLPNPELRNKKTLNQILVKNMSDRKGCIKTYY